MTNTQQFWNKTTVLASHAPIKTKQDSLNVLEYRFSMYPYFKEYMNLWGNHTGETILDYGCGPAHDVVGFATYSGAKKVYGVDISELAIKIATDRLSLHSFPKGLCELIKIDDGENKLSFEDNSIDHIYSEGVLHHTIYYPFIIKELYRILKPGKEIRIMVYNRDSIWFHYYVGAEGLLHNPAFNGCVADQVAGSTTDGPYCPVAMFLRPDDFVKICQEIGFETEFLGGYYSLYDIRYFDKYGLALKDNKSINPEHREFASKLTIGNMGRALYRGKPCGIGGCYLLRK